MQMYFSAKMKATKNLFCFLGDCNIWHGTRKIANFLSGLHSKQNVRKNSQTDMVFMPLTQQLGSLCCHFSEFEKMEV